VRFARRDSKRGTVYLLHFEPAYKHARHYRGFVDGDRMAVMERLRRHLAGNGARLIEVAAQDGCTISVARIWRHRTRAFERNLKHRAAPSLCPICLTAGENQA
jgi:hypothetical protein